jgi:hypothetical protein
MPFVSPLCAIVCERRDTKMASLQDFSPIRPVDPVIGLKKLPLLLWDGKKEES